MSTLHNPHSIATPTQLHERAKRRARLARLDRASLLYKIEAGISSVHDKPCRLDKADALEPRDEWVARQKRIPIPKALWFSVVSEIGPVEPAKPLIDEVIKAVAKYYGVSRVDILSARRTVSVVRPRQVGYYLAQKLTLKSLPEIGRRFGGRVHTSALSGIRKIERLRRDDPKLDADLRAIASSVGGSLAA